MSENPVKVKEIAYSDFLSYVNGIYFIPKENSEIKARLVEETSEKRVFQLLEATRETLSYPKSEAMRFLPYIRVTEVVFKGKKLEGFYSENPARSPEAREKVAFVTYMPMPDPFLLKKLEDMGVRVESRAEESSGGFLSILYSAIPYLLLFGVVWFLFFRQVQEQLAFNFVKSKAKLYKGHTKVTFSDVAGVDEAKEELKEIVEFKRTG